MRGWWDSFEVLGKLDQRLRLKLKLLRDKLRVWNKEVFGNVDQKKKQLLEEINFWDLNEESHELSNMER